MNILLTGASGFLGSSLARHLQGKGHTVSLLLRAQSKLSRLKDIANRFSIACPQSQGEIDELVRSVRPDVVIHTACSYARQGKSVLQLTDANIRLGLSILQALQNLEHATVFINTGSALDPSVSPYALSKFQMAQWGEFFASQNNGKIKWINILLQHMYGAGDDPSKFTTHVIQACHKNEPTLQLTAGEQKRDFIYIEDVVSAYEVLLSSASKLPNISEIEVGSGVAPSIREFVEIAHRLTHSTTKLMFGAIPYRANEAMHCQANIQQMVQLGWQPTHDLTTGLQKTIELEFA